MRVLVVTNMYPSSSSSFRGVFVERQVESLLNAGLSVEVEAIAGPRGRADYLTARPRVARHVRGFGPDIVHVHFGYSGFAGLRHGPPSVMTLHGSDVRHGPGVNWRGRVGAMLTRALVRDADLIIVQNEGMKHDLRGSTAERTVVMSNGIDESMFHPMPRDTARARLDLPPGELILMFVDAGDPKRKRPDLAAAAVRHVTESGRQARLLTASGIAAGEMPWYYAAADALLMTSDYEGSPMCVKEALACGTPVVSVPVGDVPQVVDTPERGAIAPRDPEKLAHAILSVAGRPRTGASLLPEKLSSKAIARRLVGMYEQLLAARDRRSG